MNTIIFVLSILSALLTGGIKLVENLKKSSDYLMNEETRQEVVKENDSVKQSNGDN